MRNVPEPLQAKLDSGATTLCRCWILTRRDGTVVGYTDHDRDLMLDGVTCAAATGMSASEATQSFGLSIGGAEVSGAITAETLNEDDLAAGLYDAAAIKTFLVDWTDPALRLLLSAGVLGEVRRDGSAFTAEIRGPAHRLNEGSGRLFTPKCSADLGDNRCKIDLTRAQWRADGSVVTAQATALISVSGLGTFADGWFTGGKLAWTGGNNAGYAVEVKAHRAESSEIRLELWQPAPRAILAGDTFVVTAGCDKAFTTCRARFANVANFRGFPHIPGNDFLARRATQGEPGNSGESLFAGLL